MSSSKWFEVSLKSEKDKNKRAIIYQILTVILIIGYILFFLLNWIIISSAWSIKFEELDSEIYAVDNETINFEATFLLINEAWNSVDITDIIINISLYTIDDDFLINSDYEKDIIPRLDSTEVDILLEFKLGEIYIDIFDKLNKTQEIRADFLISFHYAYYGIETEISTTTTLEF